LELVEAAQMAFFEYYLAERQRELNAQNVQSMKAFRQDARKRYEANLVTEQDVLQSDVELARLERRQVELERNRGVAIARLNPLLHGAADGPLPPSPKALPPAGELPSIEELRQTALSNRPDLAAIAARLAAEQSTLALAWKNYRPDLELMGRYDTFWQEPQLRTMVGVNANVPIYRQRLDAAVREACFRVIQRRAEYQQRVDDIHREVQTEYEQLQSSRQLIDLYQRRIVPAARQNIESARAGYMAAEIKVDFLRVVQAQR